MTEPTYEYVKGQGWVPSTIDWLDFELYGIRCRIEARKPNPGEAYTYCSERSTEFIKNGQLLLSAFVDFIEDVWSQRTLQRVWSGDHFEVGLRYVTVIPYE